MKKIYRLALYYAFTLLCLSTAGLSHANNKIAADKNELIIGQVVSLSRNGGDIGKALMAGQELYFRSVNEAGGVHGKLIRLVSKDDQYIPEETVKKTRELIDEHNPIALIGYRGTANALELRKSDLLKTHNIPVVGFFSGAQEIRTDPYLFHVRTTFDDELEAIARLAQGMGHKRIAAFYQDDAFGKSGLRGLVFSAEKYGIEISVKVAYERSTERAEASLREASRKVLKDNPDAVVLIAVADQTYTFVKQLRDGDYKLPIYSISVADPGRAVALLGKENARGLVFNQVYPFPHSDTTPLVREFNQLRKRYQSDIPVNHFSIEGFVNAKVLVEAIRRAGPKATRQAVYEALRNLGRYDLGGFSIEFTPNSRQGSRFTDLTVLNGEGVLQR